MNAKRLTMALLVSLLISGLFTFWLSRRVAKRHSGSSAKANDCWREGSRWKRANC